MQQHPVPQHIASYEFRLIGDMTLRQFGLLASGCVTALLIYASGLPSYFKWPLVIFFVILGVAMAFIPVEERPLHQWLVAFFKASYSPTQFLWEKSPQKLAIFEEGPAKPKTPVPQISPADKKRLAQYLSTLPAEKNRLEEKEEVFLNRINNLFSLEKMPSGMVTTPSPQPASTPPLGWPPSVSPSPPQKPVLAPRPAPTSFVKPKAEPEVPRPASQAQISPGLPFPQKPQSPNLLVGMVLDANQKIIENAIIEIRNSKNIPVRALKSNRLGQFRIVTPLKNDVYQIEVEKPNYTFDIIEVNLKGKPVEPIEIRAKGTN